MDSHKTLTWDDLGQRTYKTGVDHVVLYVQKEGAYPVGVPWNGVTAINESPSGAEETAIYADNIKYLSIRSKEDFGLTIECYDTPVEFDECDGCGSPKDVKGLSVYQQTRKPFGLSYRTKIGNDEDFDDHGYELHLVYGCTASPSELAHNTINDSVEPGTLSYEITTVAAPVPGMKASAHLKINSLTANQEKLQALEEYLYGDGSTKGPELPLPEKIINEILKEAGE